jgi:hypothetical protein
LPDVFISYSRVQDDLEAARFIQAILEKAGLDVWRDEDRLTGGKDFLEAIFAALRAARAVVLLISPASARHDPFQFVLSEITSALENRIAIVPSVLQPAAFPAGITARLRTHQWLDLYRYDRKDWATLLYSALEGLGLALTWPADEPRIRPRQVEGVSGVAPSYAELRSADGRRIQYYLERHNSMLLANPEYGWAHLNIGLIRLHLKDHRTAYNHLLKAAPALPGFADAQYFAALCLAGREPLCHAPSARIRAIEEHLAAAQALAADRQIYDLLEAILVVDHYRRNGLRRSSRTDIGAILKGAAKKPHDAGETSRLLNTVMIEDESLRRLLRG